MIKAIIFDLDNTLTHRERSIEKFSNLFVQRFQTVLRNTSVYEISNLIKETDNGGYGRPENPHPKQKHSIAIRLHRELDWLQQPEQSELLACWVTCFSECAVELPGALELIKLLKREGYQLAVISNGAEMTRVSTLKTLQIFPYLDCVVSSGAFGTKKPDAAIFEHVVKTLGCLPSECVYVGDHPVLDIEGARLAGLHAVWVEGFHTWPREYVLPRFSIGKLMDLLSSVLPELEAACG